MTTSAFDFGFIVGFGTEKVKSCLAEISRKYREYEVSVSEIQLFSQNFRIFHKFTRRKGLERLRSTKIHYRGLPLAFAFNRSMSSFAFRTASASFSSRASVQG
jgi:hypothetical protein